MPKAKPNKGSVTITGTPTTKITDAQMPLYALADLAATMAPLDSHCRHEIVTGLTSKVRGMFFDAAALLPKGHPAIKLLEEAISAMYALDTFILYAIEDSVEKGKSKPYRYMVAQVIQHFTGTAGRWMERAEQALNEDGPSCGYLDGFLLEGGDMRQLKGADHVKE